MTARANWFVGSTTELDETNPFEMPIEEVGEYIDLTDPEARLALRAKELLHREAVLFNAGITCGIKELPDSTCHACPVSKAHDETVALSRLCRLGREQEVVLTELAVLGCQRG